MITILRALLHFIAAIIIHISTLISLN